jgi:hypothetical protein
MCGKRPDLLDHVADLAAKLDDRYVANAAPVDADVARVVRHEPVDHLQRGRLAAARRAHQHAERARRDDEREVVDRGDLAAGVSPRHMVEDDLGCAAHAIFRMPRSPMIPPEATSAEVIHIESR